MDRYAFHPDIIKQLFPTRQKAIEGARDQYGESWPYYYEIIEEVLGYRLKAK